MPTSLLRSETVHGGAPLHALWRAVGVALLLFGSATVAPSQTIQGAVRDEVTGRPVAGGAVFLTDMNGAVRAVTRSSGDGSFILSSTAGDTVRVRVERSGYETAETRPWVLKEESVLELEIKLHPLPMMLDTLTVSAEWRSRNRAGFERRRRSEIEGTFADDRKLGVVRLSSAAERIRPFVPGMTITPDGIVKVAKRGVDISGNASCQPRFIIDGVRYPGDMSLDMLVSGRTVRAMEYYREPIFAPGQFSIGNDGMWVTTPRGERVYTFGPPCAIIVIWTDIGFGEAERQVESRSSKKPKSRKEIASSAL